MNIRAKKFPVVVDGESLTIERIAQVAIFRIPMRLARNNTAMRRIALSREVKNKIVANGEPMYGVTTGFGGMAHVRISPEQSAELQNNLIFLQKASAGRRISAEDARAGMLLRANSLMRGVSGIRFELIERLETFLNAYITPHVYEFGSIGASGDLIPLGYIAGAVIGLHPAYTVDFDGVEMDCLSALSLLGLSPVRLEAKEGLAMINGTSVMTGIAANCLYEASNLVLVALAAHALFIQALRGTNESFHPFIHKQKPHSGQQWAALHMLGLLDQSKLIRNELDGAREHRGEKPIQDRYSLRCLAQFLGPIIDGILHIGSQIEDEANSANDNPIIDGEGGVSFHGGNFLGQYVGIGMDHLRAYIGLCAKHLDAQIALLVSPEFNNGLPPSLVGNRARLVNMGLKMLQVAANSMAPHLTFLGNSFVDRFPTHAEQFNQNISSLGYGAANLARESVRIFREYLAICLLFGVQAVDLRAYEQTGQFDARSVLSPATSALYEAVRESIGCLPNDKKPLIWNDDEQFLDEYIQKIAREITPSGKVAHASRVCPSSGRMFRF